MRKDSWTKLGCFLTGWNYQILKTCTEASRKQLHKYASAILILIILWAFIGYSFADRYINTPLWGSVIVGVFFVTIIIQVERQIILTVGRSIRLAVFRIVLAVIMAVLGSAILDQIIFKDDIEKKMIQIVDRQVREQLPGRITIIDHKLQALQSEIDSLDKKNLELYEAVAKRPTIRTVETSVTYLAVKQEDGSFKTVPQRTVSTKPISNPKTQEVEKNTEHLNMLRKQQEVYTQRKIQAESSLRKELKSKQGFLEELTATVEILGEKRIALLFYLLLFLFLTSLELFVVVSKSTKNKADYDLVIEHQLEQKKKTLKKLEQRI